MTYIRLLGPEAMAMDRQCSTVATQYAVRVSRIERLKGKSEAIYVIAHTLACTHARYYIITIAKSAIHEEYTATAC